MNTTAQLCATPFGEFLLQRYPARPDEPLQAWCAADLLLLEEAHARAFDSAATMAVNDDHGALSVPLLPLAMWTDSALAALALQRNLATNGRPPVPLLWSVQEPPDRLELVVMRIPKSLPYFQFQLDVLARRLAPGTRLLAAGMDKHLSPRVATLLEAFIGRTERHPGRRKARLFSALRDERTPSANSGGFAYHCPEAGGELRALPNVFSPERLDGGSRLLLTQLTKLAAAERLLDLACGNGVLGLAAFRAGLAPRVLFADESAMALASVRANAARLFPGQQEAFAYHHGDGVATFSGEAADLVLCNPPFHLGHTVDDYAGRRLLQQCGEHLPRGGRLCLVANRHLDYRTVLKRDFTGVEQLAADRRFCVWLARRR